MEKIRRKTLLYKSGVEYSDYCINHIEGCGHGCKFPCYAFKMSRVFGKVKTYDDWIEPKLVENALELLEKEIPKHKGRIKFVHLCFSTDPFMYGYPEVKEMSLAIIKRLNLEGIMCTSLTKGLYPLELINAEYSRDNEYGITLVSLDEGFRKKFEPFTSPYPERVDSLRFLHDAGLKTWVSIEPYPTPNIVVQSLEKVLAEVSFVDKIIFGRLNYNKLASQFKGHKEFYDRCIEYLEKFCIERRKEFRINRSKKDIREKNKN